MYAIFNMTIKSYIANSDADYIYTKLIGNARLFETSEDAEYAILDLIRYHPDFKFNNVHRVIKVENDKTSA